MEQYLKENYLDDIIELINDPSDEQHVSLRVDLTKMQQKKFEWFEAILQDVQSELPKWDNALFKVQNIIVAENDGFMDPGFQVKEKCHVRFVHLPATDIRYEIPFPSFDQVGEFLEVKGIAVRISQMKLLELRRDFICTLCKEVICIAAEYDLMYRFEIPSQCSMPNCKGEMRQKDNEPLPGYCVSYQEIKMQEVLADKNIPLTIIVTAENDLVDLCQPGDCITVCGTIERRWQKFEQNNVPPKVTIALRAVSISREQKHLSVKTRNLAEQILLMQFDWTENVEKFGELAMRDIIVESICPDVYGMLPVKLGIALSICSCNTEYEDHKSRTSLHQRGQSHVLMVGDPGLAKSKLLLSAVDIAPRAVHTVGMGCSSAGLTAAAVKEDGEWQLEAGALVLADGGICCIDEFNLMRESDRVSIHEAMEQQTISIAKAGIVCKLNTRCAIIAAANPKNLYSMSEPEGPSAINIGISSPLLSRFDLVFTLCDERIPEWDDEIINHLMSQVCTNPMVFSAPKNTNLWNEEKLQTHFAAVCNVHPKMTHEANEIISAYYLRCREDPMRDMSRTTVRLLNSLNRLAEAHARLVFRSTVTALDAIVITRLMESTFGFGRVIKPYDVIKEKLPLGPDESEIQEISKLLQVNISGLVKATKPISNERSDEERVKTPSDPKPFPVFKMPQKLSSEKKVSTKVKLESDYDFDELDRIFSLDDTVPFTVQTSEPVLAAKILPPNRPKQFAHHSLKTSTQNKLIETMEFDESDDDICSQVMDELENTSNHASPVPKIRKIENADRPSRLHINLSRFAFQGRKSAAKNKETISSSQSNGENSKDANETLKRTLQNRIFCTPSDDEGTPIGIRNRISAKASQIEPQLEIAQQLVETSEKDTSDVPHEKDSAYETMDFESSNTLLSALNTRKSDGTPALFPSPSAATVDADTDLSFLDTLEF